MRLLDGVHDKLVFDRRARILATHLAASLPKQARVLDVGSGDGLIASLIMEQRPDISVTGVDVLVRPSTRIPVVEFDGSQLPYDDDTWDVVMFVDVLHHTDDPTVLLGEAARVARGTVLIKDHTLKGLLSGPTLRFMDRVGNARHGVALPFNYWTEPQWRHAVSEMGARFTSWNSRLGLYWGPFSLLFDRDLHFVASIDVRPADAQARASAEDIRSETANRSPTTTAPTP